MEVVLFVSGGAMRGVFSAGALEVLSELGLRERVSAVYGVSAGAFNAALFATGTAHHAARWYCEIAPTRRIITSKNPFTVLRGHATIDLAEAQRAMESEHLLDVQQLIDVSFPVYFGVVDAETKELRYLDARRPDALNVLQASSAAVPFARAPIVVDGRPYIDGGFRDVIGLPYLRERHPGARFVVLLNSRYDEYAMNHLLATALIYSHDHALAAIYRENARQVARELEGVRSARDVLLIRPDESFPVDRTTTDCETLARGYELGRDAVLERIDEVARFCDLDERPFVENA